MNANNQVLEKARERLVTRLRQRKIVLPPGSVSCRLDLSPLRTKRFRLQCYDSSGAQTTHTDFGEASNRTYLDHGDPARRANFLSRTSGMNEEAQRIVESAAYIKVPAVILARELLW